MSEQQRPIEEVLATLAPAPAPLSTGRSVRPGDRVFAALSGGASGILLMIIALIAAFLVYRTIPALQADTTNFLTTRSWFPDSTPSTFGIAALVCRMLATRLRWVSITPLGRPVVPLE